MPFEKELVERDEEPIEDDHVSPSSLAPTRCVMEASEDLCDAWRLDARKILIRPEYYETEQAAPSTNESGKDIFMVAGQPGIGSSPPPSPFRPENLTLD